MLTSRKIIFDRNTFVLFLLIFFICIICSLTNFILLRQTRFVSAGHFQNHIFETRFLRVERKQPRTREKCSVINYFRVVLWLIDKRFSTGIPLSRPDLTTTSLSFGTITTLNSVLYSASRPGHAIHLGGGRPKIYPRKT